VIFNTHKRNGLTSIYLGVSFDKKRKTNPWRAKLAAKTIGFFDTPEEAARAYDSASVAKMGAQFATTNFPISN
jgi:hypothetical protein